MSKKKNSLQLTKDLVLSEIESSNKKLLKEIATIDFNSKSKISAAVKVVFNNISYEESYVSAIENGVVGAATAALTPDYTLSTDKYLEFVNGIKIGDVKLSTRIRQNAKEVNRIVSTIIKKEITAGTTWKQLTNDISKIDKVADVAGVIIRLSKIRNSIYMTDQQKKVFSSELSKAKSYISTLSDKNEPSVFLKKAYTRVVGAVESNDKTRILNALQNAIDKKIMYNAERIARTELANSYNLTFKTMIENDPDITGFEWVLSSGHNVFDECDFYAELDSGSGAGVYAKDDFPEIPAHPNCMCSMLPYVDDKPGLIDKKNILSYINSLSIDKKESLFGSKDINKVNLMSKLNNKGILIYKRTDFLPSGIINKKE